MIKKFYIKIIYSTLAISLGVFIFVYGGYDDSPGAQLIGLIVFIGGVVGLIKNKGISDKK
jgi:hypothetical protein